MKRLITYFLVALLILAPVESFARTRLLSSTPVYKGTVTGLRVSAVDGTAFIDNLPYTYSSDFSAGVDGWTEARVVATGNIDDVPVTDDNWLRVVCTDVAGTHVALKTATYPLKIQKYQITYTYYIPSGQSNVDGVVVFIGGATGTNNTVTDTVTTVSETITTISYGASQYLRFYATDGGVTSFTDPGGDDVFYIKDVTVSEITPYMDGNHSIEIYDSSNRMVKGVLKAAGTSEGLGDAANVSNCVNGGGGAAYDTFDGVSATGFHAINTYVGTVKRCGTADEIVVQTGELWKIGISVSLASGTLPSAQFRASFGGSYLGVAWSPNISSGGNAWYTTTIVNSTGVVEIISGADSEFTVSNLTASKVTAPSSSGATIVSAKAGETYNFSYKNASFTYNAASYYCIIRAIR